MEKYCVTLSFEPQCLCFAFHYFSTDDFAFCKVENVTEMKLWIIIFNYGWTIIIIIIITEFYLMSRM